MKKITILITISLFLTSSICLGNNFEHYDKLIISANQQYELGNYDSAITLYAQVVNASVSSPNLYYNLGNAYYKTNQLAPAIYYFEKAKKLAPFDNDITFNLEMVKNEITDKIVEIPTSIFDKFWMQIRNLFSINQWGYITTALFLLVVFFVGVYLLSSTVKIKKLAFFLNIGLLLATIASFTFGFSALNYVSSKNKAIIFSSSLSVKSEPKQNAADLFIVHEGTAVNVIGKKQKWSRISLSNGNEGWVNSNELKQY